MRIARLHMDPQDKLRFEIHGKGSVKYHLKANHMIEAKRWYWTLNNAIQFSKDEAKKEAQRRHQESEMMGRLREQHHQEEAAQSSDLDPGLEMERQLSKTGSIDGSEFVNLSKRKSVRHNPSGNDYMDSGAPSFMAEGDFGEATADEDELDDDDSSHGSPEPPTSDQLALTAHSARLQLDLLSQVALALQFENVNNPDMKLSDASVVAAISSYEKAAISLESLIGDLVNMGRERDKYWRKRLERETALRKLWEENMTKLAEEQEQLEDKVMGERERRKKTKRALRQILRKDGGAVIGPEEPVHSADQEEGVEQLDLKLKELEILQEASRRGRDMEIEAELYDSDSSAESDLFFDAVDAGEVDVVADMPVAPKTPMSTRTIAEEATDESMQLGGGVREKRLVAIRTSCRGYEDAPRARLALDDDKRPKVSLWVSSPVRLIKDAG